MKKVLDITITTLLIAAAFLAVKYGRPPGYSSEVVAQAYDRIDGHLANESRWENERKGVYIIIDDLMANNKKLVQRYKPEIERLEGLLQSHQGAEFKDLAGCQSKYNSLLVNYEDCLFSNRGAVKIIDGKDAVIMNLEKAGSLMKMSYESCQKRALNYAEIIAEYRKRRWGWYVGAGPFVGITTRGWTGGVSLNLSYGFLVK